MIISEEELDFCESWFTPKSLIETLFSDFDNLADCRNDTFGEIRLYQMPFISDESIIDFEETAKYHQLKKKQTFRLKKNVGDLYNFGARKFGKTLCTETLDLLNSLLTALRGIKVAFASVDLIHIRAVLDQIKVCIQNHPICKLWERRITGAPDYKFELKNNYIINSVNFNIGSKNPGRQWFGKHVERVYIEEASLETQEVYEKRKDALSELGAVFRLSGMTNFTPHSPAGKAFYALENQKWILNLPQYINPMWDEEEKRDRLEFYGGLDSIGYRVFVKGEVVEDGITTFDMPRIRKGCYKEDRKGNPLEEIKRFEISKDRYKFFKQLIIVERPTNAERIFVSADIGERTTELIIHSEVGKKYNYLYNIVLYNLTHLEQWEIIKYICQTLQMNVLAFDCGDGMGRAIYREAEKVFPKENLVWYDGSSKIEVDFELDSNGKVKMDKGKPVLRQEYMSEWSVQRLKDLLYEARCNIPRDYKLDMQFSAVMSIISGTRIKYKCVSQSGDHLFDSWRVFAIAQWLKKDFNLTKPVTKSWGIGAVSWN